MDSDEQIVDPDWAGKGPGGLQDWLATAANVRVQHHAQRDPAGYGVEVEIGGDDGHWVKSWSWSRSRRNWSARAA